MAIKLEQKTIILIIFVLIVTISISNLISSNPVGPDQVDSNWNSTKSPNTNPVMINISGGYISYINISSTIQNTRWKAFVGQLRGSLALKDATGAMIYDWSLVSLSGNVYSTRNSTTISWGNINCSNITTLNQENINLNHTNGNDNITATFNLTAGADHNSFMVGSKSFPVDYCPVLTPYTNNKTTDANFEEVALYDGISIVYASLLNDNKVGYNGLTYDFQMMVPEDGSNTFTGATPYYLYVEIGT